jgi:hypothetical protein
MDHYLLLLDNAWIFNSKLGSFAPLHSKCIAGMQPLLELKPRSGLVLLTKLLSVLSINMAVAVTKVVIILAY